MSYQVQGTCNQCGQCCGYGTNVPAFPFGFFSVPKQYEESPDCDINSLPEHKRNLYLLTKNAWDIQRVIRIGTKNYSFMIKSGCGLVKSATELYCPFIKDTGATHPCQIWNEAWCVALCHNAFPNEGQIVEDNDPNLSSYQRFFEGNPNCGYHLELM